MERVYKDYPSFLYQTKACTHTKVQLNWLFPQENGKPTQDRQSLDNREIGQDDGEDWKSCWIGPQLDKENDWGGEEDGRGEQEDDWWEQERNLQKVWWSHGFTLIKGSCHQMNQPWCIWSIKK